MFSENQDKEVEKEKLDFSEVGVWISKKKKENEIQEKEVSDLIQEKIRIIIELGSIYLICEGRSWMPIISVSSVVIFPTRISVVI